MDSERIAICKEFQPALLKIASSQFLGGSRLSGSVVKASWRAALRTGTVPDQDNTPGEPLGNSPREFAAEVLLPGRKHVFFSRSSAGGGCPPPSL